MTDLLQSVSITVLAVGLIISTSTLGRLRSQLNTLRGRIIRLERSES